MAVRRHIYIVGIAGVLIIAAMAATISRPDSSQAVAQLDDPDEWPAFRMTYETLVQSPEAESADGTRVTELTYSHRREWTSIIIEPAIEPAEKGATRTFANGSFDQHFPSAQQEISERIPEENYVIPDKWLDQDRLRMLESRGFEATHIDDIHKRYDHSTHITCEELPEAYRDSTCYDTGGVMNTETYIVRTDVSNTPLAVEHIVKLGDVVLEHTIVTELYLLDDGVQLISAS